MRVRTDIGGVQVVALAYGIDGLYCTKLPSDLGGVVTKNEKQGEGDTAIGKGRFFSNLPHPEKKRALPES